MARKRRVKGNAGDIKKVLEYIFSEILYQYQRDFILDSSQLKICNKARQIGISEAIALSGVLDVLIKNENVFFVSRSLRQSISLLDKFYKWLKLFEDNGIVIPREVESRTECKLNGIDVKSLTSKAVTGEGYAGNLYLDEFALHDDDEQLYKSLFPTITHGYNLTIVSRPFGQSNMFYKIWTGEDKYKDFARYQINIHQAIKQGLRVDLELLRNNIDDEGFRENYECEFIDESTSYLPYNLLRSCIRDIGEIKDAKYYIGLDVGRTNDATAICVLGKDSDNVFHLVHTEEIKKKRFVEQKVLVSEIIDKYNPVAVIADKGSVGYQMIEDLEHDYKFVKGVMMSNDIKMESFTSLKKKFEEKTLLIPDDIDLINQLHSIKREFSGGGKLLFTAERTSRGHSDLAFALALAVYATGKRKKNPTIRFL